MKLQDFNFHKQFFKSLPKKDASEKVINQSCKRVNKSNDVYDKICSKGEFPILLLGANKKPDTPSKEILSLRKAIQKEGFNCCTLGTDYYKKNKGAFQDDVQTDMLNNNDCIILVNASKPGVIDEGKAIKDNYSWNTKTFFFFDYNSHKRLVELARDKEFPIYFKYPVPYKSVKELKAKVLFIIYHYFLYIKRKLKKEGNLNEKE